MARDLAVASYAGPRVPARRDKSIEAIVGDAKRARDGRSQWMSLWDTLAKHFLPEREFLTREMPGTERMDELFTSVPILARRALATAVSTMLRPANRQWFRATAKDERLNQLTEVRLWLDMVTRLTLAKLYDPRARFEEKAAEVDNDLVTFGTGILYMGVDRAAGHFVFRCSSLRDACIAENERGHIDRMYEWPCMTLSQIVGTWGIDNLPKRLTDKAGGTRPKWDEDIELLHVVIPNVEYAHYGFAGPGRLPFLSLWIDPTSRELIEQSGFYEFPYAVPRWDVMAQEVYGRSPAMTALPDARVLNAIAKTFLQAGEKAVNPPLTAPADMLRGEVELFAGGLTLYDAQGFQFQGPPIRPIDLGANIPLTQEIMQGYEERIFGAFYRDILMLPNRPDMTAEEIRARTDEFLRQAAPVFARVEADYNAAIVERAFSVLLREGIFGKPPDVLQGKEIEFQYESPVKAVRERARALSAMEAIASVGQMAALKPEVTDNINFDDAARLVMRDLGAPEIIVATNEQAGAIREQRNAMMMAQQAAAVAQQGGDAAQSVMGAAGMAQSMQRGENPNAPAPKGPAPARGA
jgi:Bacteriophage head to tail connecting protein